MKIIILTLTIVSNIALAKIDYKIEKIVEDLGVIWGFDFLDDNKIIFTEKLGKIGILNLKNKQINYLKLPFNNLYNGGQGGLLDIQNHNNGYIYLISSRDYNNQISTVLSRFKLKNKQITNFKDLFISKTNSTSSVHFGSRITFNDKFVYFSIGDRGNRDSAQNLNLHNGSIIRLNLDGSIPQDNPKYTPKDSSRDNNKTSAIYSYGHRNPQGLFFDKTSKKLFSIEHGPRGGDEINIIHKGRNYGWPIISYGREYWAPISVGEGTHKQGMEQPLYYFTPSIAPSDLLIYRGKNSNLDGAIISSSLKLKHLNIIKNTNKTKEQRILKELNQRIRAIKQYKKYIYLSTDSGNLYKLTFN